MRPIALATLGLLLPVFAFGALADEQAPAEEDGAMAQESSEMEGADGDGGAVEAWYTAEQADTGQRTFAISCGGCHGTDMVDVFATYDTAEEYFLFSSGSMPADNPGGLAGQQYVDIIAYLMRENGFPAGEETLSPDREILAQIVPADGAAAGGEDAGMEEDGESESEGGSEG